MLKILIYSGIIIILFWSYVRFMEGTTIFLPSSRMVGSPKDIGLPFEDIYFTTQDKVTVNGWLIKAPAFSEECSTVLFFHGNAGNISDRFDKIAIFHQLGLNVFIIDYRGYGNSKGDPSEQGLYRDAIAAYDYLKSRPDIDHTKIISYGESLGGAVAIDLAKKKEVAALIADSTFTSAADMSRKILPLIPSFFLSVKFDSLNKINKISVPKLFIHSIDDEIVPYIFGKRLFHVAMEPKEFLELTGSHNEAYFNCRKDYINKVRLFLKKHKLHKREWDQDDLS